MKYYVDLFQPTLSHYWETSHKYLILYATLNDGSLNLHLKRIFICQGLTTLLELSFRGLQQFRVFTSIENSKMLNGLCQKRDQYLYFSRFILEYEEVNAGNIYHFLYDRVKVFVIFRYVSLTWVQRF